MRAEYKHFRKMCEQTFNNSPSVSNSSSVNGRSSTQGVETLYVCSIFVFANSQNLSTLFSACPSMSQDQATVSPCDLSQPLYCLRVPADQ